MNGPCMKVLVLALAIVGAIALPVQAVTDEEVVRAIEKAKEWLINQGQNGSWPQDRGVAGEGIGGFVGGGNNMALHALAYVGEHPNRPVISSALEASLAAGTERTYVRAMRTMALAVLKTMVKSPKRELLHEALKIDAKWLVEAQGSHGGWNYDPLRGAAGRFDLSNTQMAILALWQAALAGVEIPDIVWKRAQELYYKLQQENGSWNYGEPGNADIGGSHPGYGSMTAAGLASIYIIADMLDLNSGCPCRGGKSGSERSDLNRRVDLALKWLGENFKADQNPGLGGRFHYYWLYAAERVGIAAGYKYFGNHDWYREGAELLVRAQGADGSWSGENGPLVQTCWAMLFLFKGRAPILYEKLQIPDCVWNSHRRDLANLTTYIAKVKEQQFQWQIVHLRAPVQELHDAPILFITPETIPNFSAEDKKKLREFTDTGGTILFEASCGNTKVRTWFMEFAREVWPEWAVKPLGPDHGSFLDPNPLKQRPEILGIDDGVRTSVFYAMDDISCPWQTKAIVAREYLFKWGINLFTYATDHSPLRAKLAAQEPPKVEARYTSPIKAGPKSSVRVVRMKYEGSGWLTNRNYKAFDKIVAELAKRGSISLKVEEEGVEATGLAGADAAYLTGSREFALTEAQRAGLKQYLAGGGFLWAEATDGSLDFDKALRKLATDAGWELKPIERNHPLMTGAFKTALGYNLTKDVQFRRVLKLPRANRDHADFIGIWQDGKLVGVFSPLDAVFSSTPYDSYACKGYLQEDAVAVATNIVAFLTDRGQ